MQTFFKILKTLIRGDNNNYVLTHLDLFYLFFKAWIVWNKTRISK